MPEFAEARAAPVTEEVRQFYDSVGWRQVGAGVYQNARFEDLRPVSAEYILRCHRRVARHLAPSGRYLLDAGSGPIQYPAYLEYSAGYRYRVCLDVSIRALREARQRIGRHGLFVVGDIARLPFRSTVFEGGVSLHTLHHLPEDGQRSAFHELRRVLQPGGQGVVVYGWDRSAPIETWLRLPQRAAAWLVGVSRRWRGLPPTPRPVGAPKAAEVGATRIYKHDYVWLRANTRDLPGVEVLVWRSVSTPFLRTFIHPRLFGRGWLRLLYRLEEVAPRWFGRVGQYPLIVLSKLGPPTAPDRKD